MNIDPQHAQIAFYVISPIATLLAVATAYLAIYRQSKPNVILHYEPSNDAGSVIDLVISNYGGGSARNLVFSRGIPLKCWGIEAPDNVGASNILNIKIPVLAPGKELRWQAGQYGGLLSQIGDGFPVTVSYTYRTPLRVKKKGEETSVLDVNYMAGMHAGNSPAYDLADAMKGRNNTIFLNTNKQLESINKNLAEIVLAMKDNQGSET